MSASESDDDASRTLEAAMTGTIVVSPGDIVEDVDDAACALLGYSREELIGTHGSDLVPQPAQPATATSVDRMRRGEVTSRRGRLLRKDGTVLLVEVHARRLGDGHLSFTLRPTRD